MVPSIPHPTLPIGHSHIQTPSLPHLQRINVGGLPVASVIGNNVHPAGISGPVQPSVALPASLIPHSAVHAGEVCLSEPQHDFSVLQYSKDNVGSQGPTKYRRWKQKPAGTSAPPRPYACSYCSKTFTQRSNAKTHERVHTGEKRFKCSQCSKRFLTKQHVVTHERIHTGEMPYECSFSNCKKRFTDRSNWKVHERSHTQEKPFGCAYCQKRFGESSTAARHERIHYGEHFVRLQQHQQQGEEVVAVQAQAPSQIIQKGQSAVSDVVAPIAASATNHS